MYSYSPTLLKDTVYKNIMYQTLNTFWLSIVSDNAGARTFFKFLREFGTELKNTLGVNQGARWGQFMKKKTEAEYLVLLLGRISRATVSAGKTINWYRFSDRPLQYGTLPSKTFPFIIVCFKY